MLKNKKFIDLSNGKVFEVIDQFEEIAILDNKTKVKVGKLLDKNYFDEYIDPNSFFKNERLLNAFTDRIRQIPLEDVRSNNEYDQVLQESMTVEASVDDRYSRNLLEPAVLPYDPEEEKRELMEKARKMFRNTENPKVNMDKFSGLIEEDENITEPTSQIVEVEEPTQTPPHQPTPQTKPSDSVLHTQTINRNPLMQQQVQQQSLDPIISMFRNVKRNTDFSLSFSIKHKIPRLDFIEMMEDSYNTSLIDFLAEEFTNQILLNPELIKNKISDEIRKLVYKERESVDVEPEPTSSKTKRKTKDD